MPRPMRKKRMLLLYALFLVIGVIIGCNVLINRQTQPYLFSEVAQVPPHRVGLVLGTAQTLAGDRINLYFLYRIQAAAELYKNGKVEYLIVSGDNSRKEYSEPEDMKQALIQAGVPADKIHLDYAGFRTLDSVVRAKEVFGQQAFIVISQPFHNQRAVFLARQKGMDAIAFNARDVSGTNSYKTRSREWLARVKVFVDLYLGKEPYFLGEKIAI